MAQNLHRRSFMALQQAQAASSARLNTANTRTATTPCQTAPTGSRPPTPPTRRTHPRIHRSSVTDEFLNPTGGVRRGTACYRRRFHRDHKIVEPVVLSSTSPRSFRFLRLLGG